MCGRDIEKSICREMSGNLESGMVAVGTLVFEGFFFLNQTDFCLRPTHVKVISRS